MELYIPYSHSHKHLTVMYVEGFSLQIKLVSLPTLDNYRCSFQTFGPHQYGANFKLVLSNCVCILVYICILVIFDETVAMLYKLYARYVKSRNKYSEFLQ